MKFILTQELGRLTRWLRILGYDVVVFKGENLKLLYATAYSEERVILTRNSRVKKAPLLKVAHLRSEKIRAQMKQAIKSLRLKVSYRNLYSRCSLCNRILKDISRSNVRHKVPPFVYKTQKYFSYCPDCKKIYWQGTHWDRAKEFINMITQIKKSRLHR